MAAPLFGLGIPDISCALITRRHWVGIRFGITLAVWVASLHVGGPTACYGIVFGIPICWLAYLGHLLHEGGMGGLLDWLLRRWVHWAWLP